VNRKKIWFDLINEREKTSELIYFYQTFVKKASKLTENQLFFIYLYFQKHDGTDV